MRHALIALAAAASPLAVTAPASAEPMVDLTVGSETRWMTSSSMHAVSSDSSHGLAAVTAGVYLGRRLPFVDLAVDVGIDGGGASGTMFQTVDAEARLLDLTASARAIRPIVGPLNAFARAGLGIRRLQLTLEQDGRRVRDRGWGPLASLGLGVGVTPLRIASGVSFGIRVEGGYTVDAGESLHAEPTRSDDGRILIPSSSASLGDLNASGWTLRTGLVVRY